MPLKNREKKLSSLHSLVAMLEKWKEVLDNGEVAVLFW